MTDKSCILADRYLPCRKAIPNDFFSMSVHKSSKKELSMCNTPYAKLIKQQQERCLSFYNKSAESTQCSEFSTIFEHTFQKIKQKNINVNRIQIISAVEIIQAPEVVNNFYYTPLDCSQAQTICVGLGNQCFVRNRDSSIHSVKYVQQCSSAYNISSLKFNRNGSMLYMGDTAGKINVIDIQTLSPVRFINSHTQRIGCIENSFQWGFLSGSKDNSIVHHDLRVQESKIMRLIVHEQQVCGITVKNGKVASSSADGKVIIWDLHNKYHFQTHHLHKGAVKALQWCPWKINLLASGGGKKDHQIILWNAESQQIEETLDGKSQITGLTWNQSSKQLLTAHGGSNSGGYVTVWDSKLKKFTHALTGHKKRVVGLSLNPIDKEEIVTLGADDTMRYWRINRKKQDQMENRSKSQSKIEYQQVLK